MKFLGNTEYIEYRTIQIRRIKMIKEKLFIVLILISIFFSFFSLSAQAQALPSGPVGPGSALPSLNPFINIMKIWVVACKGTKWQVDSALLDQAYRIYKSNESGSPGSDVWVVVDPIPQMNDIQVTIQNASGHKISENQAFEIIHSYIEERYSNEMKIRQIAGDLESQGKLDNALKEAFPNRNPQELKKNLLDSKSEIPNFSEQEIKNLDKLMGKNYLESNVFEKISDKSQLKIKDPKALNWKDALVKQINDWSNNLISGISKSFINNPLRQYYLESYKAERDALPKLHNHIFTALADGEPIGWWENGKPYDLRQISQNLKGLNELQAYYYNLTDFIYKTKVKELEIISTLSVAGTTPEVIENSISHYNENYFYPEFTAEIVDNEIPSKLNTLNQIADNFVHDKTNLPTEYVQIVGTDLQRETNQIVNDKNTLQANMQSHQNEIIRQKVTETVNDLKFYNNFQIQDLHQSNITGFGGGSQIYISKTDIEIQNFLKPDAKYEAIKNLPQVTQLANLFNRLSNTANYSEQLQINNQIESIKNTNTAVKDYVDTRLLKIKISNEYKNGDTHGIPANTIETYFNQRIKQIQAEDKINQEAILKDTKTLQDMEKNISSLNDQVKQLPRIEIVQWGCFPANRPEGAPSKYIPTHGTIEHKVEPVEVKPPGPPLINPVAPPTVQPPVYVH